MKLAIFIYHVYFTDGDFHDQENNSLGKILLVLGTSSVKRGNFTFGASQGFVKIVKRHFHNK